MPGKGSIILSAKEHDSLTGGPSFSLANRVQRALWIVTWLLFAAWTPRQLRGWRVFLLRLFGAVIGNQADVRSSARVWLPAHLVMGDRAILAGGVNCYNMAPITIEQGAIVSQRAHLCAGTHDIDDVDFQLVARPITLGAGCWVAAEAFVGPGVAIGEGAVLGARSVAFRNLDPWTVYSGNPATAKRQRRHAATAR